MQNKHCEICTSGQLIKINVVDASITVFQKSVDRSIQTVVSCLFNPENRLRNTFVSQEDYFKVCGESKLTPKTSLKFSTYRVQ